MQTDDAQRTDGSVRRVDADVLVAGAGPVGILVAAEVALGGASVVVLERDLEASETVKAGSINLASAEILARRGLVGEARRRQAASIQQRMRASQDAGSAEAVKRIATATPRAVHFAAIMLDGSLLDPEDPDTVGHGDALDATMIPQRDVQEILEAHAERLGVEVRRGVTVLGLRQDEDLVEVETDAGPLRARWVVGCDGGRSVVRHVAGFGFPGTAPEITGRQAVVEFGPGSEDALDWGWHWSTRGVYRLAPGGVVATVEMDGPPEDRESPVTTAEIRESLGRVTGTDVDVRALRGAATRWTDNARQVDSYRRGRVFLAGDAAHVHSPFSGQGLNLGLGDATNLGWKLAAVVGGRAPEALLDSYDAERRPVGAWVLDWTRAQVALMRSDEKTGHLREVVTDLLGTRDGLTRVTHLISGVTQRVELPGADEHPLLGRLVPDVTLGDGSSLRDRFEGGRFVLLDRTTAQGYADLVSPWDPWIEVVADSPTAEVDAPSLLARPDGVVVWTDDTDGATLVEALETWAGPRGGRSG